MQKSLRCKDFRLGFGLLILFGITLVILNFGIISLSALQAPEKDSEIREELSSLNWPGWLKSGSLRMDDFLPAEAAEMKPTIQRIRRPK